MNINRISGGRNFGMAYWFEPTRQLIIDAKADCKTPEERKFIRNLEKEMDYYCPDEEVNGIRNGKSSCDTARSCPW